MRECRQCRNPIIGRTRAAIFCGYACKEKWHIEAGSAARAARRKGRPCIVCAAVIESTTAKAVTCSRVCGVRYQNEKRQAVRRAEWDRNRPPCAYCGGPIPDSRRAGVRYCSPRCKGNALSARWRERHPTYNRHYLYGMTPEQYTALLEAQDGLCAICRTDTPGGKGSWHVDHDHATDKVRGLLCHNCNLMLGNAKDDPARLEAAIAYLR